jgi:hypothetical protein
MHRIVRQGEEEHRASTLYGFRTRTRHRRKFFAQPDLDPNTLKIAAPPLSPGQTRLRWARSAEINSVVATALPPPSWKKLANA